MFITQADNLGDALAQNSDLTLGGAIERGQRRQTQVSLKLGSQLENALFVAANCHLLIPEAQRRIHQLLEEAEKEDREISPIEHAAREYQIEYIARHLQRASDAANERLEYLSQITTQAQVDEENERCAADVHHWFRYYAWGYDPRPRSPLNVVPFILFPAQERLVDWLEDVVFNKKTSGIIEKSRDEGATDLTTRWSVYHWRFTPGFSALFSSRKEDAVDSKKNMNTIFERCRFQIRYMPQWMLPKGFNLLRDLLADKFIYNPENLSSLVGEAPTENIGRSGRATVAFADEFAFYPFGGYPQYRSLSQTTDSIIPLSSVAGKLNKYADLALDGQTAKFVMDWRENPLKDKRWYDSLPHGHISPKMTQQEIAQEVDRDYDASQPGKVFKFNENYLFMTREEVVRAFQNFKMGDRFFSPARRFIIPADWDYARFSDYGQTDGHEWGYLLAAVPTKAYPKIFQDTVFVFIATHLLPTGLTIRQAVALWREWERDLGLRNETYKFIRRPKYSKISHEQKDTRKTLLDQHGETWTAWETNYNEGISGIQDRFDVIDKHLKNPFRPELMGRARIIFVAPNDEFQFAFNERLGSHYVTMSAADDDQKPSFAQLRKELPSYHYAESERGKPVKEMRPVKEFDNIIDPLRSLGITFSFKPKDGSKKEQIEQELPEGLQELAKKKTLTMGEQLALEDAYREAKKKVERRTNPNLNSLGADLAPAPRASIVPSSSFTSDENGFEMI